MIVCCFIWSLRLNLNVADQRYLRYCMMTKFIFCRCPRMEVWKKNEKDLKPEGYRPISRLQDSKVTLQKLIVYWCLWQLKKNPLSMSFNRISVRSMLSNGIQGYVMPMPGIDHVTFVFINIADFLVNWTSELEGNLSEYVCVCSSF